MNIQMRFEGGKELAEELAKLPSRVGRRMLIQALKDAAEPMRERASRSAPHEPGAPDLRENIAISVTQRIPDSEGGSRRRDDTEAAVAMGPTKGFFYGFFQEFGTVHHGAQPFMRPAFDHGASPALDAIRASMWQALAARGVIRTVSVDAPLQGEV